MNALSSPIRIGIFYDGNFLLHASNYYNYFHPEQSRLSINGLHDFVRKRVSEEEEYSQKKCQVVGVHYFRGRINAVEASQRGNQLYNDRVFEDILMAEGVHTHYLPLRNFSGKKEERGIDVWLSLEVFECALRDQIDVAVLIVSDTNFVPLMRKVSSLGVRTMLLSWEFDYVNDDGVKVVTKTSHELRQLATYPISMHAEIERGLAEDDPYVKDLFVGNEAPAEEPMPSPDLSQRKKEVSEVLSIKNGFGFVKYPNNNLYFHMHDVIGDFFELAPGDPVEFVLDKNQQKQDIARQVRKLEG